MGIKPRGTKLGTEHFKASEFACKDGSKVPAGLEACTQLLMIQLEVLREALGGPAIAIMSGYRSPEYNAKIDGAKSSKHMTGEAADIRVKGRSPEKVADTIESLIREGKMVQGGLGRYGSFTHYDVRGVRARWGSNG